MPKRELQRLLDRAVATAITAALAVCFAGLCCMLLSLLHTAVNHLLRPFASSMVVGKPPMSVSLFITWHNKAVHQHGPSIGYRYRG